VEKASKKSKEDCQKAEGIGDFWSNNPQKTKIMGEEE
jgi:hypothetical protein